MRRFLQGRRTTLVPILVIVAILLGGGSIIYAAVINKDRVTTNCEEIEKLKQQLRVIIIRGIQQTRTIHVEGFTEADRQQSLDSQYQALDELQAEPCPREAP